MEHKRHLEQSSSLSWRTTSRRLLPIIAGTKHSLYLITTVTSKQSNVRTLYEECLISKENLEIASLCIMSPYNVAIPSVEKSLLH